MLVCAPSRGVFKNMEKTVNNIVMRVECRVRSEFTVPGWTEFTFTLVPVRKYNYITRRFFQFFLIIRLIIWKYYWLLTINISFCAAHGFDTPTLLQTNKKLFRLSCWSWTGHLTILPCCVCKFICVSLCTFESTGQLSGKKNICQFTLAVC